VRQAYIPAFRDCRYRVKIPEPYWSRLKLGDEQEDDEVIICTAHNAFRSAREGSYNEYLVTQIDMLDSASNQVAGTLRTFQQL
jgi:hypothetical protein